MKLDVIAVEACYARAGDDRDWLAGLLESLGLIDQGPWLFAQIFRILPDGSRSVECGAFSFTVRAYGDGTIGGQSNVQVHAETAIDPAACEAAVSSGAVGSFVHAELDCLSLFGNIVIASGTVTQTNEEFLGEAGFTTVFAVQDNGEGANAEPDRITRIPPFPPDAPFQGLTPPVTCSSFSLPMIEAALARVDVGYAIEAGNVQVR